MNLRVDNTNLETIESSFNTMAESILNSHLLDVKGHKYRVINIEFYYYNESIHKDENSHALKYKRAAERQLLNSAWYLHKVSINPKYKHKGIDFTFGDGKNYGGILIKEVIKESTKEKFSQSKFVDELKDVLQPKDEKDFLKLIEDDKSLNFEECEIRKLFIDKNKRKGLVNETFKDSEYAFKVVLE